MEEPRIRPAGDAAVVVDLGDRIDLTLNRRVHAVAARVKNELSRFGTVEVIAGYTNLLVSYEPTLLTYHQIVDALRAILPLSHDGGTGQGGGEGARRFVLPAVYGGEFGPDLEDVARYHHVDPEQIVRQHSDRDYPIFCIGFSPGQPLLGGLSESLHTPRLETPRPQVPAGSVAIGASQTGVYPTATPGGWRLIGRTPLVLFDFNREPPVPYRPGDLIRFQPIDSAEYQRLRANPRMPEGEPVPLEPEQ